MYLTSSRRWAPLVLGALAAFGCDRSLSETRPSVTVTDGADQLDATLAPRDANRPVDGRRATPDLADPRDLTTATPADLAVPSDLAPAPDLAAVVPPVPPSVLTQHNDNQRSGANLREAVLNVGNVNVQHFGKLFSRAVDGYLYAQPLYVPDVHLPGGRTRNVVYLATEHNSVYAFDADDPAAAAPYWQVNLGPTVPSSDYTCIDLIPEDGITSTPVIDAATNTLYVSPKSKENGRYIQRLHALDLATGAEKLGGPIEIAASVPDGVGGMVDFVPELHLQRPALTLANGVVYLMFGSHCDHGDYHGWIIGYDAATLGLRRVYNTTPGAQEGSIWQSGQGATIDSAGNLYVIVANGTTAPADASAAGECFLRLTPSLSVVDWFTPYNYNQLNLDDNDLGSSGALILDDHYIVGGGKEGILYLLDKNQMGHFHAGSDSQVLQSFRATPIVDPSMDIYGNIHGSPVFWNGPGGRLVYLWGEYDHLKAFSFVGGRFVTTPAAQSPMAAPIGMPGGILSVSADGGKAGTGIVWASLPLDGNANTGTVSGVLRAFDASDVSNELWNSNTNAARDGVGSFAKFASATVVNGKVYLGTFSGTLNVYGLLR